MSLEAARACAAGAMPLCFSLRNGRLVENLRHEKGTRRFRDFLFIIKPPIDYVIMSTVDSRLEARVTGRLESTRVE